MVTLILAAQQAHLGVLIGLLAFGLLVGVFGHIIHSRTLILTGILLIGIVSAYFSFVLEPGSR
jgi:hypothetical protein